jgi:hypothetical protein
MSLFQIMYLMYLMYLLNNLYVCHCFVYEIIILYGQQLSNKTKDIKSIVSTNNISIEYGNKI